MERKVGDKEAAQRELARNKRERLNQNKKLSTSDLRGQIARIKPMSKRGGKRGR